jgi:hypothetical protein
MIRSVLLGVVLFVLSALSVPSVSSAQTTLPAPPAVPSALESTCPNFQSTLAGTGNSAVITAGQDRQVMCALLYQSRRLQDLQAYEYIRYLQSTSTTTTSTTPDATKASVDQSIIWMRTAGQSLSVFIVFGIGYRLGGAITI